METGYDNLNPEKRFIESVNFPFSVISEASEPEKGPGRPPHWEMVFWWTRKPLISARAIIAGCLLPEKTDRQRFLRSIGINIKYRTGGKPVFEKTPHRVNPELKFKGVRLLDPFAGFGSIPLECLRLGLDATAVELLPTAYVFLKAVLEYPAKYGKKLVGDVEKWGNWVTERLKEDPLIKELYDEDVAVYIGSWEVKCPNCGKWTPLVGNWWLARVKGKEGYERLAWMEPEKKDGEIAIKVMDLNKKFGDEAVKEARVEGNKVVIKGKEYRVPESTIEARRELGTCLHCNQPIMQVDPETGRHYTEVKKLPKEVKEKLKSYVKFALDLYNKGAGYGTSTDLPSWLNEIPARLRLLVKVRQKRGDLEFEPCTASDQEKPELAKREIEKMLKSNDPDVPKERLAPYGTQAIGGYLQPINYNMTEWYKLFNPRQLLTLIKLVKLIREAGKQIEQEKVKEGLSKEEAFKYAEAITTYLAIALIKYADYNSIVNYWNASLIRAPTMAVRGIAMQWNFCDTSLFIHITGSFTQTIKNSVGSLSYLSSAISNDPIRVRISLDDATVLSKLDPDQKFGLIITDPPYYNDVPYSELSDFYYVWLKRALSNIRDRHLEPRFMPEALFERVGDNWVEIPTQWEKYALSEISLNPPRLGSNVEFEDGIRHFQNLLNASFVTMASKLEDYGLLVTYYAHTDPNAWKALLKAGWEAAELRITNAFPLTTESAQSVVKRGKLSMDTSIVVVWRKGCEGSIEASELYTEMVEKASERARELLDLGIIGRDLIIGTLAAALATATRYREVRVMGKIDTSTLVDKYVYPATYLGLAKAFARKADLKESVKMPEGMFYLIVKSTTAGAKKKILESTDARIFSIGTSLDLNNALRNLRLLKAEEKENGSKVAKAKVLRLLEPTSKESSRLAEFLEVRGVGVTDPKIRCSVDALHLLEYWAVRYAREEFRRRLDELKAKYPVHVEDALSMARIMARVLPSEDMEKELCNRIVEYLEPAVPRQSKLFDKEEK
jgi:putative DNA methylase